MTALKVSTVGLIGQGVPAAEQVTRASHTFLERKACVYKKSFQCKLKRRNGNCRGLGGGGGSSNRSLYERAALR